MYVENYDDLNRKYAGGYAFLSGELVYIREFVKENDGIHVLYDNEADMEKYALIIPEDIGEINIDAKFVNIDSEAILIKRSPQRQWKRSICHHNTIKHSLMHNLYASFNRSYSFDYRTFSFGLVKEIIDPKYPSYNDAIDVCEKKGSSVAFSPMYAICLSSVSPDKYLVASIHGFIGEGIKDHIWIKHKHSQQEMEDFIRRSRQYNIKLEAIP
jgi:hypothetical protein